jgi:GGDEF domain-containing protein
VCRWGGDEFLAAASGSTRPRSYALAEQLRCAIAVTPFAIGADQAIP